MGRSYLRGGEEKENVEQEEMGRMGKGHRDVYGIGDKKDDEELRHGRIKEIKRDRWRAEDKKDIWKRVGRYSMWKWKESSG